MEGTFPAASTDGVHGLVIASTGTRLKLEPADFSEIPHTFEELAEYQFLCEWCYRMVYARMNGRIIVE